MARPWALFFFLRWKALCEVLQKPNRPTLLEGAQVQRELRAHQRPGENCEDPGPEIGEKKIKDKTIPRWARPLIKPRTWGGQGPRLARSVLKVRPRRSEPKTRGKVKRRGYEVMANKLLEGMPGGWFTSLQAVLSRGPLLPPFAS